MVSLLDRYYFSMQYTSVIWLQIVILFFLWYWCSLSYFRVFCICISFAISFNKVIHTYEFNYSTFTTKITCTQLGRYALIYQPFHSYTDIHNLWAWNNNPARIESNVQVTDKFSSIRKYLPFFLTNVSSFEQLHIVFNYSWHTINIDVSNPSRTWSLRVGSFSF